MKKSLIALVLSLAVAGACFATTFAHTQTAAGGYSAIVTVPSAANCYQYGAAYVSGNIYNAGPLGAYTVGVGDPALNVQGAIDAGTYSIQQTVAISGYSGTVISW